MCPSLAVTEVCFLGKVWSQDVKVGSRHEFELKLYTTAMAYNMCLG